MPTFNASEGRTLYYQDTGGTGPVVLCLAGLTRNARDFEDLSAFLAPEYRVVRLDSRGRGHSEWAKDPLIEYTIPNETSDAVHLIEYLECPSLALIGTSRGGILSMAIVNAFKERVWAIVLNDVGAVVEGRGLLRILSTLGREPAAKTFAEAAAALRVANEHAFPNVSLDAWERHARAIFDDEDGRPVLSYDPRLRAAVAAAINVDEPSVSLWPLFDSLQDLPLLVAHGENSDILTRETVEEMKGRHPQMDALHVPDRGHAPFLNEPEALRRISDFLGTHRASAQAVETSEGAGH